VPQRIDLCDTAAHGVEHRGPPVAERVDLRHRLELQERQLSAAYEELQSSNEELETTNEELQSAVEELETTNEELQSSNEELETMNEELQSTNEELQTLNDELRDRTLEVDRSNGFLHSILAGLDLAVVVVDSDERVQLWNVGAERLTGMRAFEAEGQRLMDLPLDVPADRLRGVVREMLLDARTATPFEVPVTNRFGRPQRRRVTASPLQRAEGELQGGVVTLFDQPADASG
jgi:two-component system CheB/CheR fusion protein